MRLYYAYDNGQVSGQQIYEYVALKPGAYFVCTGAYVMYVVDPAGFTVQLDINGDYTLSTCDNSDWDWDVDPDHGGDRVEGAAAFEGSLSGHAARPAQVLREEAAR